MFSGFRRSTARSQRIMEPAASRVGISELAFQWNRANLRSCRSRHRLVWPSKLDWAVPGSSLDFGVMFNVRHIRDTRESWHSSLEFLLALSGVDILSFFRDALLKMVSQIFWEKIKPSRFWIQVSWIITRTGKEIWPKLSICLLFSVHNFFDRLVF